MKKLKIIIPLLIIIAVAAAAVYVVMSGKLALTDKSKVAMGLSKTLNTFETAEGSSAIESLKIFDNISSKPYEADSTMSIDVDVEDLESLLGDNEIADLVNDVCEELANTEIATKVAMDQKEKEAVVNLSLKNENLIGEISGEIAMSPEEVAFRSKELNEDYLVITKEDAEDSAELEEAFTMIEELFTRDFSSIMFTKEEIKHFDDTYGNILADSVKDEMITSEKSEFEVNGAATSCTKAILTYNNDQFKELITKYVTTFENDEKGKEILENKFTAIYGDTLTTELMDELDVVVEDLKTAIESIAGTKLEFVTYASALKTFGTETIITIDEESMIIKETFNDDNTVITVSMFEEELAKFTVRQSNKEVSVDGNIIIDGTGFEIKFVYNNEKMDLTLSIIDSDEVVGTVGFNVEFKIKSNTEKEYAQDSVVKVSIDVPIDDESAIKGTIAMNVSETMKIVDSIDFPDTKDAVSLMDETALTKYGTDCTDALNKYAEKLQESELVTDIIDMYNSFSAYTTPDFDIDTDLDIDTDIDTEIDTDINTTEDAIDPKDLEDDITDWYSTLEAEEGTKKTELVEENMITDFDFLDDVTVTTYISWEEGNAADEGYVGIEVTDSEDNSYEFYIDLSSDKVYTEDTVTFDTSTIEWNEF